MHEIEDIVARCEIEALRGEFTDAAAMNDHERLGSLFTPDGAVRIPEASIDAVGPDQIRAMGERREALASCFVQNTHSGVVDIDGDTASGHTYIYELFQLRDGTSHVNHAVYHDRYQRTADGWKFAERVYEIRYLDTTPLTGHVPNQGGDADHSG